MRRVLVIGCLSLIVGAGAACGQAPAPAVTQPQPACDEARMQDHRYVSAVEPRGRYFTDQHGDPLLVFGDSPWAGMVRWSPTQAEVYFADREARGFNASIVSLIGAIDNGGPGDDGRTYDGLLPFEGGDVTRWNEAYWQRVDEYVQVACAHGNTLFLYPVDGWTVGNAFRNATRAQAHRYGEMVAARYARFPNIVWMTGGDHFPNDLPGRHDSPPAYDELFGEMLSGIRSTGDNRPFSIQLGYPASISTDSPQWAPRVDFDFVYTYLPTYRAVLDAYRRDRKPALLSEANYEGENNLPGTPVTGDVVLRRQMAWALTSGSPGYFYGSDDWELLPGWEGRLDTPAVVQLGRLREFFESLEWPTLVPDESAEVITGGRGDPVAAGAEVGIMGSDYVTAARAGGSLVAYVPTARTLTVDPTRLAQLTARWVDPADATAPPLEVAIDPSGAVPTPGRNSAGGEDWLLLLRLQP
ncbi:apiosidase-like domain-containing protein [Pseudonocardia sp. DLS-67]